MTIEEAKAAYYADKPVIHDDIEYKRISALIYRKEVGKRPYLRLELFDKCEHSVMIVSPEKIKEVNGDER